MNKVLVRCWEALNYRGKVADHLFITYPEENSGHNLITCLSCGEIYAVTLAKEIYVGPSLDIKIKGMQCEKCCSHLEKNYASYPDTYVVNGERYQYQKSIELPEDSNSLVKEFYGIYE